MFHPHDGIIFYAGASTIKPVYPPSSSTVMYHDQTEGHFPTSSAAPGCDYGFGYAMAATVFENFPTCSPYQDVVEPCLPLDDTTLASPTVTRETGPSVVIDPSVSGPPSGMGDKETTELPRGTSPPGTNNTECRDRKKRKHTNAQDEPRKLPRHGRTHHPDPQQRSTHVSISGSRPVGNHGSQLSHL